MRFLRGVRGYKNHYYYYAAMIIDPILRFNWIFYAIYTSDLQHSTLISFLVGFSEITRRGIWTIFRVENEHCSNVAHFKASRDVPLPYKLSSESEEHFEHREEEECSMHEAETTQPSPSLSRRRSRTGTALEAQESPESSTMRRRPVPPRTFTRMVAEAHTQDFEKKRRPGAGDSDNINNRRRDDKYSDEEDAGHASSDEDDDEQDAQDALGAEVLLRERRGMGPERED